jgi:hypothetical protein
LILRYECYGVATLVIQAKLPAFQIVSNGIGLIEVVNFIEELSKNPSLTGCRIETLLGKG